MSAPEVVGVLPCPCTRANRGAADLLEAQLFAYGVGSSVAIVDVHGLQLACLLQGGHRNHTVTAVKWSPDCHSRDLKSHSSHLRLASGDSDGGVVVWSASGAIVSRLEDHVNVREHIRGGAVGRTSGPLAAAAGAAAAAVTLGGGGSDASAHGGSGAGSIAGLAWVLSSPTALAILVSPGTLLLWDTRGECAGVQCRLRVP
ncbi:hypothetical protein HYH03_011470 [Edaphochlamys debaryana]|uniref:WDR11 first beta-propeller domain-containing protein n=1 Tax=Edaphochlamys debaryana TaxID=47281 RepID=A0A836BWC4_9CHLO|nr:hypothetical protein HYH03_011470 [Edaphochlamys debaryana]|eukprot:KAG2490003.1 hypothetical protein HYH03_011470 [Edaphochlamys debaryana]